MTHKKAKRRAQNTSSMPIWLLGGALALAIIAVGLWVVTSNAESGGGTLGPQLAVNQERIDFGRVPFDKMVRAEFKLENRGDRTLTIDASTPVRVLEGC